MIGRDEQNLALALYRDGVRMWVGLDAVGGSRSFELKPKDVPVFLEDRDLWAARQWGVSKDMYIQWKQAGGFAQCSANAASGRRCRNGVAGPPDQRGMVDPPEFAELIGGYCHVHGG